MEKYIISREILINILYHLDSAINKYEDEYQKNIKLNNKHLANYYLKQINQVCKLKKQIIKGEE